MGLDRYVSDVVFFNMNIVFERSSEGNLEELFVEAVLNPCLPLEERNVRLDCFLVELLCINSAHCIHVWTVELDCLASQSEELLHGISFDHVVLFNFFLRLLLF